MLNPNRIVIQASIEDAGHFTKADIERIISSYPEHEREARTKGIPQLGSGRIFPVAQSTISIQAFAIPEHWPRIGGLDFGWDHPSAAVVLAWDRDSDCLYVTHCHRAREQTPAMFTASIKPWGEFPWAWPHDGLQHDKGSGDQLAQLYKNQGLRMLPERATFDDGSFGVEAGVADMLERMQTSRWKVFAHLADWFEEFNLYHRKDGLIVKEHDDAICAARYANMMRRWAKTKADMKPRKQALVPTPPPSSTGWMGV